MFRMFQIVSVSKLFHIFQKIFLFSEEFRKFQLASHKTSNSQLPLQNFDERWIRLNKWEIINIRPNLERYFL